MWGRRELSRRLAGLAVCGVLLGCPRPGGTPNAGAVAVGPVITRLEPAAGPAGVAYPIRLTIEGTGFAPVGNAVRVGPVVLLDVPSANGGTRIVVFVPKETPSTSEVPPAPLLPGHYEVTVTTAEGTSAPAIFMLTPGPGSGR